MTAELPTPKPAGHRALRNGRVEVNVSRPVPSKFRPGLTAQRVYRTGRFATEKAARRWAEGVRGPGERAAITYYGASDGWRSHAGPSLTDEGWRTTAFLDGYGGDPA